MTKLWALETLFLRVIKLFHIVVELFGTKNIHKIPLKFSTYITDKITRRLAVYLLYAQFIIKLYLWQVIGYNVTDS